MKSSTTSGLFAIALTSCLLLWQLSQRDHGGFYKSTETRLKVDIKVLESAVAFYEAELDEFPRRLSVLTEGREPFMNALPLDPWCAEYIFELGPSGENFRIGTYGADGLPGGKGAKKDIFSEWTAREHNSMSGDSDG